MRLNLTVLLIAAALVACDSSGDNDTGGGGSTTGAGTGGSGSSSGSGSAGSGSSSGASSAGSGSGSSTGSIGAGSTTGRGTSSGGSSGASTSGGPTTGGSSGTSSSSGGGSTGAVDAGTDAGEALDAGSDAGLDAGTPGDAGFQSAARSDWPVFSNPSGHPVLDDVQLVTITFTGYPFQTQVQDFGAYILGSSWFQTIGADYGVGSGSQIATYNSSQYSAAIEQQISDTDIEIWLEGEILSGALPSPSSYPQVLYMMYFPASVSISNSDFGQSCSTFDGYHSQFEGSVLDPSLSFSYAVIVDCEQSSPDELASIETTASHELAESATDPEPITASAYLERDLTSPWVASQYIVEIGDVCEGQRISDLDAGFTMQQIWSISAAADGGAPCVPVDPNRPYFGVTASPSTVQSAAAGSAVNYTVTGWSSGPIAPWDMVAYGEGGPLLAYEPIVGWTANTLDNGQSAQLSVGVPGDAGTASVGVVMMYSELPNSYIYSRWPIVVNEQ